MSSSTLGNTREIGDKFHFYAIHFLWERKSAKVLIYIYIYVYIYTYIRIVFSIELRLRVSCSLRSLANYCTEGRNISRGKAEDTKGAILSIFHKEGLNINFIT